MGKWSNDDHLVEAMMRLHYCLPTISYLDTNFFYDLKQ